MDSITLEMLRLENDEDLYYAAEAERQRLQVEENNPHTPTEQDVRTWESYTL